MKHFLIRLTIWIIGLTVIVYTVPFLHVTSYAQVICEDAPCPDYTSKVKDLTLFAYEKDGLPHVVPAVRGPSVQYYYPTMITYVVLFLVITEAILYPFRKRKDDNIETSTA